MCAYSKRPRAKVGTSTLNRVFKPYRSKALDRDALKRGAEWADFGLRFNGATNTRNCAACPATSKILEDFSQAHTALHGSAYFSLLAPRTHIKRHCGPTNARLRLHLGLVVPDGCSIRVGDETDDQRKRHLEKELHGAYDHLKTARFWRDTTESGH
ncbi:peptide-aspartate beta-dioxygenase [Aureococcus anophagefferens]|nr:peptide-aspartate beta-dioxygenase [Aureococcus anophagefferens]